MRAPRSIRWRIQLWYAAFLTLVVVTSGVTVYRALKSDEASLFTLKLDADISTLLHQMGPIVGRYGPLPSVPPLPGEVPFVPPNAETFTPSARYPYYYAIWEGTRLGAVSPYQPPGLTYPEPPEGAQGGGQMPFHGPFRGQRKRGEFRETYEFTPGGRNTFLIGRSVHAMDEKMVTLAWTITGIGTGVLALGLAVGWWIGGQAMRPLRQISEAAHRISSGNLSDRINVSESESELGSLAGVLNDAFSRLESAIEHEARFTADAAHELRTPVSVLLAETQLALDQPATTREEALAAIAVCRRAALRMQSLIESLLDLSVVEAGTEKVKREPCDLAEIARGGLEIMHHLAGERSIRLISDLSPARCNGDPERILQVLLNLLSNALKFSPDSAEVTVVTRMENGCAILAVRDTGRGISLEHLPHIFERFYRVDGSRTRSSGGAGLGLAICKSIATAHGGTLTAESIIAKGSTFTFSIPVIYPS